VQLSATVRRLLVGRALSLGRKGASNTGEMPSSRDMCARVRWTSLMGFFKIRPTRCAGTAMMLDYTFGVTVADAMIV
jgi:hypothetical protein